MNIDDMDGIKLHISFSKQKRLCIICFMHHGMCICFNKMTKLFSYIGMFNLPLHHSYCYF